MPEIRIKCSDPGSAASAAARAAVLYARVCGYNAENAIRESNGHTLAYDARMFEEAIADCFPEALARAGEEEE